MSKDITPTQGQCLVCGGRGGWWTGERRDTCSRCGGTGWDPERESPWFPQLPKRGAA